MPGLDPLPPSGKHFCLAEEVQKVKVAGDKVTEIKVSVMYYDRNCYLQINFVVLLEG
jgi:hypothetical protein